MAKKALDLDQEDLAQEEGQYAIRPQTDEEMKRNETVDDVPVFKVKLDLDDDQQNRLADQFKEEFDALKEERKTLGLEKVWESSDRQYDGDMKPNARLAFNLHTHQSKIKVDAIVRALNEAYLDSDPMIDVSPRPEEWREEDSQNNQICEQQQQFLQYEVQENIQPERDLTLINLSAVKKFVGIGKLEWCYEKEKRRREEQYEGTNEEIQGNNGQVAGYKNQGLEDFIKNYPDAPQRYPKLVEALKNQKKISIVVQYLDTVCNCAKLRHVKTENFYVKNSTNYYDGLKKAHGIVERQSKTWYELQKAVRNKEFDADAVDTLKTAVQGQTGEGKTKQTYKTKDYDICEYTTYFLMEEGDEEETKIKAWFAETQGEKEESEYIFLGSILYPYYGFDIDYRPFYVKLNEDGFYGGGKSVIRDLKDSNIAQDAILNLALHSMYVRNILTPIVPEGSEIVSAFIENRWSDGKPIEVDSMTEDVNKAISFVQYPQLNLQDFMVLGARMQKIDDDVSGITSGISGRENPSDPHAPASKTIALLNQAGVNIKDYIRIYLPSFNGFMGDLLQLYYQMSQEGRKFQIGKLSKKVTGKDAFATLDRATMIAKTNIQARASAFAFDKSMEKQENTAVYTAMSMNPLIQVMPEAFFKITKIWLKSQGKLWENFAEDDLLSPDEFKMKQLQTAIMAMQGLFKNAQMQQQMGQPPDLNPELLANTITQAQMQANNPKIAAQAQKAKGAAK